MDTKDGDSRRTGLTGLSLSAILGEPSSPSSRTLKDIIREDPNNGYKKNKKNWTAFKDMMRLQRAGVAWTSIITIPVSDVNVPSLIRSVSSGGQSFRRPPELIISDPILESTYRVSEEDSHDESNPAPAPAPIPINRGPQLMRRDSSRVPASASKRYISEEEEEKVEEGEESAPAAAESISLMSLLAFDEDDDEDNDGEDDEEDEDDDECVEFNTCSVCMVSHKGEAFVPCGHNFCRLCSRELWVQRGSCPLCNGFVVEVLDIF